MIYASELDGNERMKQYIAELAYHIGGADAETCGEMMQQGHMLARDPLAVIRSRMMGLSGDHVNSAIWNAQVKIVFPIIEAFRAAFIKTYRGDINGYLPVSSMFGTEVTNAMDLDMGNLYYLVKRHRAIAVSRA